MDWNQVPRKEIPWFPTVDSEKCTGCKVCYKFCSHQTYGWDEEKNISLVANPYHCVVGCTGCQSQCPVGAISFPDLSVLQAVREKYRSK